MPVTKRIVCLANSRKGGGTCVAGRVLANGVIGPWLRPVSDRENESLVLSERRCTDGSDPALLDIVDIPLLVPRPTGHQVENWLIDAASPWVKVGRLSWSELPALSNAVSPLWEHTPVDGPGTGRVAEQHAATLTDSIRLIAVTDLTLSVVLNNRSGRLQVRGRFQYARRDYDLAVTDPVYEARYGNQPPSSRHPLGPCYVTISLGENYNGHHYKLMAAILRPAE